MAKALLLAWITALALLPRAASAQQARGQMGEPPLPGPWHFRSIPCLNATVLSVTPRLYTLNQRVFTVRDFEQSGVVVTFKTRLGVDPALRLPSDIPAQFRALAGYADVTHYQNVEGNDVMTSERRGDIVQVCFLGPPIPTKSCNPDKDARGRLYRVYDYRQHASYEGWNSEHACGGA